MQRKEFIKRLGLGSLIVPIIAACGNDDPVTNGTTGSCTVSPAETEGPFPTKTPSDFVVVDIRSDRAGVEMVMNITIQNKNNSCAALAGAMVDVWHCDKDGYYSEYGGSGMQAVNLQSVHFLRGRQTTDNNGLVSFKTIFPGWYSGRAPHIHVHVYDASGKSLLVTQIAFPTDVCNTVYTTATQYYTKGKQDTPNATDNVFSDSLANELGTVTGNIAEGFVLTDTIIVSA
jgi:protocatechuate 3,4-dioxygenase beta subunit